MSISKVINYCAADTKEKEVKEQINRSKEKKIHINTSDS
jgi:hypothetical protein